MGGDHAGAAVGADRGAGSGAVAVEEPAQAGRGDQAVVADEVGHGGVGAGGGAPGMWPATGSTGSSRPWYLGGARASRSTPGGGQAGGAGGVEQGSPAGAAVKSPGSGSAASVVTGRPAATQAPRPPSSTRASGWLNQPSSHQALAAPPGSPWS